MSKAFEGDFHIGDQIKKLCDIFGVRTIIETGTYKGKTTLALSNFAPEIHTIEINPNLFAKVNFVNSKINKHLGSSPEVLEELLHKIAKPCLFYLDAHWYEYWPLLDELKVIGEMAKNSIIVVHDFFVPGRADLGYDQYHGQKLCFDYIRSFLPQIYPSGYKFHYNSEACGANRGVIYIYPV